MFSKTVLTPGEAVSRLAGIAATSPALVSAFKSDRVAWPMSEKIMLAVTSVLKCRYCNWMHSDLAAYVGVGKEEIERLLSGDLSDVCPDERPAVHYAMQYAIADGKPEATERETLCHHYDADTVKDIELLTEFVFFTNKMGNTFDAFIARLHGEPPINSHWLLEAAAFCSLLPLYGGISVFTKKGRNPFRAVSEVQV